MKSRRTIQRRSLVRAIVLQALLLCCFVLSGREASAQTFKVIERPPEELLIVALRIDQYSLSEGFFAYLPSAGDPRNMLLPLGELSQALEFSIDVDPGSGTARGWFIREDRTFFLDVGAGVFSLSGQTQDIPPGAVEVHFEDIYLSAWFIKDVFGIDMAFDFASLTLTLKPDEPLPFQARLARRKQAERILAQRPVQKSGDAPLIPDYEWISLPAVFIDGGVETGFGPGDRSLDSRVSIQGANDLLKASAVYTFLLTRNSNTRQTILETAQLTLSKNDRQHELLGPLKAGRIQAGDVDMPQVPLLAVPSRGRGVAISSQSQGEVLERNLDDYVLDETGPVGWDVEVYVNGRLNGFSVVSDNGRFQFEDLNLNAGFNLIRIVLYGPQGEIEERTIRVSSGPGLLKAGSFAYDVAMTQAETDLIPNGSTPTGDFAFSAQGDYGISRFLSVGLGMYHGPQRGATTANPGDFATIPVTALPVTVTGSLLGILGQLQAVVDDKQARAVEGKISTRVEQTSLGLSFSANNGRGSVSDTNPWTATATASRRLGPVNASLRGTWDRNDSHVDSYRVENRLTSSYSFLRFSNEVSTSFSPELGSPPQVEDRFLAAATWNQVRYQAGFNFSPLSKEDILTSANLVAQTRLAEDTTLRIAAGHSFASDFTDGNIQLTGDLDKTRFTLRLGGDSKGRKEFTVSFGIGFGPASETEETTVPYFKQIDAVGREAGTAQIRAFIDQDGDGVYDIGEPPLPGAGFYVKRKNGVALSGRDGIAYLSDLPVGNVAEIRFDGSQLQDIYTKPLKSFVAVETRPGVSPMLDFPFARLGELEGFARLPGSLDNPEPIADVEVGLLNLDTGETVARVTTESDGYFLFQGVQLGRYRLQVKGYGPAEEGQADIDLTPEDNVAYGVDLVLRPVQ